MPDHSVESSYPIPLFLHCRLAVPSFLQSVLSSPKPPKLRKALVFNYVKLTGHNSAVTYDGRNWGEWAEPDRVEGMVYMIANKDEENRIKQYVGDGCVTQDEEIELMPRGFIGWKETVRGKILVRADGGCMEDE